MIPFLELLKVKYFCVFWNMRIGGAEIRVSGAALRGEVAVDDEHREHDTLPTMPLWCLLATRLVKPISIEAQCAGADAAMKTELPNLISKKVRESDDVYSLNDIFKDESISAAMLSLAFAMLGIKGE